MKASSNYELRYFENAADFLEFARGFLEDQEANYSLMLGLAEAMSAKCEAIVAWAVVKNLAIQFLVFQTPPHNLILSAAPDLSSVEYLAQHMALNSLPLRFLGLVGPVHETEVFRATLSALAKVQFKLGFRQRLYLASSVSLPKGIRGELRQATLADLDQVTDWSWNFVLEALPNEKTNLEALRVSSRARVETGTVFLWMIDGKPVAQAAIGRPTRNGISMSLVYTPIEHRGSGFASSLVGALTDLQLKSGRNFCTLYTDLSNRTSNAIYSRLGYRAIADSIHWIHSVRE